MDFQPTRFPPIFRRDEESLLHRVTPSFRQNHPRRPSDHLEPSPGKSLLASELCADVQRTVSSFSVVPVQNGGKAEIGLKRENHRRPYGKTAQILVRSLERFRESYRQADDIRNRRSLDLGSLTRVGNASHRGNRFSEDGHSQASYRMNFEHRRQLQSPLSSTNTHGFSKPSHASPAKSRVPSKSQSEYLPRDSSVLSGNCRISDIRTATSLRIDNRHVSGNSENQQDTGNSGVGSILGSDGKHNERDCSFPICKSEPALTARKPLEENGWHCKSSWHSETAQDSPFATAPSSNRLSKVSFYCNEGSSHQVPGENV
eukprot:CAMPEP_0177607552 /NCGR_PEP_ID=MMETSP0419_2-20121207/17981_1 /TAXON_ID=582737 /ORGANISM="Tetraselmis sp., Strain GSL018" /LENGTH=315 /DNA_ID=CAMNT_0019102147 /DNA_START=114 /DNA_END=1057 /DNA_ORIENTATION=+